MAKKNKVNLTDFFVIINKGRFMKQVLIIFIALIVSGCSQDLVNNKKEVKMTRYDSFQKVWDQVESDKLETLPQNKVSFMKLFKNKTNNIKYDANRTLVNNSDILESFDKLAHPNGICFKGFWQIDTPNIYSGYFKENSKALIIARASTALSNTKRGSSRPFGLAGKIYPTLNPNEINKVSTANFFLIDNLGGTDAKYYSDVELTNEPKVSFTMEVMKNLLYAVEVAYTFEKADKHSGIRQLYEISELGESGDDIITPKWMKVKIQNNKKVDESDFRDELRIAEGTKLIFDISVANKLLESKGNKNWEKIGTITFDSSVISHSCDHRLHFHHPKYRDDLKHNTNF